MGVPRPRPGRSNVSRCSASTRLDRMTAPTTSESCGSARRERARDGFGNRARTRRKPQPGGPRAPSATRGGRRCSPAHRCPDLPREPTLRGHQASSRPMRTSGGECPAANHHSAWRSPPASGCVRSARISPPRPAPAFAAARRLPAIRSDRSRRSPRGGATRALRAWPLPRPLTRLRWLTRRTQLERRP